MERLSSIQGLRGFAIGGVLACHVAIWAGLGGWAGRLLGLGSSGVDLFFVISGFCLAWTVMKRGRLEPLALRPYLRRRAWRILPAYYVALLLAVLASYAAFLFAPAAVFPLSGASISGLFPTSATGAFDNLATHVTLAHGLFPAYNRSIDGAFWSLSTEWQFYLILPTLLLAARRWGVVRALTAAALASVAFSFFTRSTGHSAPEQWVITANIAARLVEFVAGMLAAAVTAKVIAAPRIARSPLLLPASAAFLVATAAAHSRNRRPS